jgi:hypothetical protein
VDNLGQHGALVRSRIRTANIPKRCLGLSLKDPAALSAVSAVRPHGIIEDWVAAVIDGKVVSSQDYTRCGKGIWVKGAGAVTPLVSALQDLIVGGHIMSGLYLRTEDYLRSERPEGEREYRDKIYNDVVILAGYGSERRTDSGWAEATLDDLLVSRFDKGLPTLVTSLSRPPESFSGYRSDEMFLPAMVASSSGKDDL